MAPLLSCSRCDEQKKTIKDWNPASCIFLLRTTLGGLFVSKTPMPAVVFHDPEWSITKFSSLRAMAVMVGVQ